MKSLRKIQIITFLLVIILSIQYSSFGFKNQINLSQDQLDQQQVEDNTVEPLYNQTCLAQGFKPSEGHGNLTRIDLLFSRQGSIFSDLVINIRKYPFTSDNLATKIISSSNVTSEKQWIHLNFSNIFLNPEDTYLIICETEKGDENNSYLWHSSDDNVYSRGKKYYSVNNGISWMDDNSSDFCFKTYGKEIEYETSFTIEYIKADSSSQINYGIKNTGEADLENINVHMNIAGGIMLTGRTYTTEITTTLEPDETAERFFFPVIGLGFQTTITLSAWTEDNIQVDKSVDAMFLPFYIYIRPS